MITLRKQYSAKYQVVELTVELEDWERVDVESANMDAVAKRELDKMVELVAKYDDKRENGIVPTPAPKVTPATENQLNTIKRYLDKAKEAAARLEIDFDLNKLTNKEAFSIINAMFAKK